MKALASAGPFIYPEGLTLALINDTGYWLDHEHEIREWLFQSDITCRIQGMILDFANTADRVMFQMRWH